MATRVAERVAAAMLGMSAAATLIGLTKWIDALVRLKNTAPGEGKANGARNQG